MFQTNDWFDCLNIGVRRKDSRKRTHGFGLQLDQQMAIINKMSKTMLQMRATGKKSMMPFQKDNY